MELALACESFREGVLGQPANSVTAFAFVVAGLAIMAGWPAAARHRWAYGLLVAAVGVGSVIQHGPHPAWQAYAHDLPLAAVLAFIAVDAWSDLTERRRSPAWWLVPTGAMVPIVAAGPLASTVAQGSLAVVAIGLSLARLHRRPALRRILVPALLLLAAGALVGSLTERTALCQPETLLQGHAAWHVLAAAALWRLTPAIGAGARSVATVPELGRMG